MFFNSEFDEHNTNILCEMNGKNSEMLMNISVRRLNEGESFTLCDKENETAILLISGRLHLKYNDTSVEIYRKNPFEDLPFCIHTCKNTKITLSANEKSEFIVQQTNNDKFFEPVLYTPETCTYQEAGEGQWNGTAHRVIVTIFDLDNAPYSNMVIGEVFNKPGRWSSYPPHHHPHPEVYYYRFDKPQGFGACFIGDKVYKIADGAFCTITEGNCHQQVTAPGYSMYYCWMIRHLDGNPWDKTRIFDESHTWLLNE